VADLAAAVAWHEQVWGRPPDMQTDGVDASWQVADDGWVRVVLDPQRAGQGLISVIVGDLDDRLEGLAGRGIVPAETETVPGRVRRAVLVDPDGNRITLGQPSWA
jgi:predicted enzyme related to lactoylglutathione lyase